jgi:hypothetical protein
MASVLFGLFGFNYSQWYYSISATFYANSGPIMIGCLFTVGCLLCTYEGYDLADSLLNKISGIGAFGVAAFPCNTFGAPERAGIFYIPIAVSNVLHFIAAGAVFGGMALNITINFTKSGGAMTRGKRRRNILYRICGGVIFAMIAAQVVHAIAGGSGPITMILETVMCIAIFAAWEVKGEVLLKDE